MIGSSIFYNVGQSRSLSRKSWASDFNGLGLFSVVFDILEGATEIGREVNVYIPFGLFGPDDGGGDGAEQHDGHDAERDAYGDVDSGGDEEFFAADKGEDDGEADLEVVKLFDHSGEQEIERAQAEDGEHVRGVDDKSICRDGKDGRDGIDGKDQIGHFDDDQHQK